ncbi:MAG: hypothetical protein A3C35_06880 [Omnitrophica bacterium RIFCSPHIGHO2_02_FULL_46_11]|nr:MAG: hypothetical protein A3C35_06880 [Omnitrophica bacterium RIFCSPHIGHO2_02_FULL_46_11]OGW86675.1 MAG: hypothetical protein A3A81_03035 [Omnitrophica bacterium RIFCSPLOWO2_01_FULL_45_10b]
MKDNFTAREVAVLVEDLKSEFRTVVEVVAPLPERLSAVEERLGVVETRLTSVEDVLRIALPDLSKRVSRIESKLGF